MTAAAPPSNHPEPSETDEERQTQLEALQALTSGNYLIHVDNKADLSTAINTLVERLQADASESLNTVIELSICSNETSISSAKLLYNLKNVDHGAHQVASSAEQMRSSVEQMSGYGDDIASQTDASLELVQHIGHSLENSVKAFEEINASVIENRSKVSEMSTFASQVRDIAEEIKGIAFQTNLLALNASVEAARAGAAGAGFSVVAQEMRQLSNRSSRATKQITELVDHFESHMHEVSNTLQNSVEHAEQGKRHIQDVNQDMSEMKVKASQVSENMRHITEAIREQSAASIDVATSIASIAENTSDSVKSADAIVGSMNQLQGFVNNQIRAVSAYDVPKKLIKLAQSDHVIWKKRLVNMISGKEGLNKRELEDHHFCRFGRWYDNVTDQKLLRHPDFQTLKGAHKSVHKHGVQAVKHCQAGNMLKALEEIEAVEHASTAVIRLLKSLEKLAD